MEIDCSPWDGFSQADLRSKLFASQKQRTVWVEAPIGAVDTPVQPVFLDQAACGSTGIAALNLQLPGTMDNSSLVSGK